MAVEIYYANTAGPITKKSLYASAAQPFSKTIYTHHEELHEVIWVMNKWRLKKLIKDLIVNKYPGKIHLVSEWIKKMAYLKEKKRFCSYYSPSRKNKLSQF